MPDIEQPSIEQHPEAAVRQCRAVRVAASTLAAVPQDCAVVLEQPLTITIDAVGEYTLMCTPTHTAALAVGFAFSEGLIDGLRDIDLLYHCDDDPGAVRLRLGARRRGCRNAIWSSPVRVACAAAWTSAPY